MADATPDRLGRLDAVLGVAGRIVAPATLISALLFYFGYVSSRAQYDYFGLDVDVIGLSTQDFVMRSPQPLLAPLLVLTVLAVLVLVGRGRLRDRAGDLARRRLVAIGVVLLLVGSVLVVGYAGWGGWPAYALVTPLLWALGGTLVATGRGLARTRTAGRPDGLSVLLWVVVAAGLFWATATVAQWSGRGLAADQARHLDRLPSVIVDSRQRLLVPAEAGIGERDLAALTGDDGYRYRYWNLRLLIDGDGAMFCVPSAWDAHATTIRVPLDDGVRVQFQFRNDPP